MNTYRSFQSTAKFLLTTYLLIFYFIMVKLNRDLVVVTIAISSLLHFFSIILQPDGIKIPNCRRDSSSKAVAAGLEVEDDGSICKKLGLPQPMKDIPLSPHAYTMDRGVTYNFLVVQMNKPIQPPIKLVMPNHDWVTMNINQKTGLMDVWDNGNIWNRAMDSKPEEGIFIDVGGWVGDTAIPSAAMGIDTYVFEPVRNNTNMIHFAVSANGCHVSEHLTVVNALVGDKNSASESVYVTSRADNAAATKAQAVRNVGVHAQDFEQPVEMVTLDSFFPLGTKVQNLKIDVQGFELQVLRGAQRILEENKERLHLRFEYAEALIKAAGNDPKEQLVFMESIGYKVVKEDGEDLALRAV